MDIEFTSYSEVFTTDLISGWTIANKTAISNLVKRCLVKNIVKKDAFAALMEEVTKWDGRKKV